MDRLEVHMPALGEDLESGRLVGSLGGLVTDGGADVGVTEPSLATMEQQSL